MLNAGYRDCAAQSRLADSGQILSGLCVVEFQASITMSDVLLVHAEDRYTS